MYNQYLLTGATGFLGRAVAEELVRRGARVRGLVLPGDPYSDLLPGEVERVSGDVCDEDALGAFFAQTDGNTCVIHCAGIVSVASRPGAKLYQVNVGGTWKLLRQCVERNVGRLIHVSSVHAIPEKPRGSVMTEDCWHLWDRPGFTCRSGCIRCDWDFWLRPRPFCSSWRIFRRRCIYWHPP